MYGYILIFFKFLYLIMEQEFDNPLEDDNLIKKRNLNSNNKKENNNNNVNNNDVNNDIRNQFINACKKGDLKLIQKLINNGYRDEDNLALSFAISSSNSKLISKLLCLKSNADPEFKLVFF